jgi:alkylation response protein AidB-like acyl-CoA dehydrogenase
MDFAEPEIVRALTKQIDRFLETEVKPLEEEYDQFLGEDAERHRVDGDGHPVQPFVEVREEVQHRSVEAGFYAMHMPKEVGGGGLSMLEYSMVVEHVENRHPNGFHDMIQDVLSVNASLLPCYEDEYLREKYFEPVMTADKHIAFGLTEPEHGSDATWLDATAERDGDDWIVNGTKCYTSNSPYADAILMFARTSGEDGDARGISAFLVDRSNPGWEMGKIQRPMGSNVGSQAFNHFENCRVADARMVGDEGEGFLQAASSSIGSLRLYIPAKAVGRSQWMFDQCVEYTRQRETFGEPLGKRQFIQGMLAEMRTEIEQTRWLYRHAAWRSDQGEPSRWEQSAAKFRGSKLWNEVADRAIQIHGGAGYMRSLPFEREYRDARAARIAEGTDEIQKRTIAREFLDL